MRLLPIGSVVMLKDANHRMMIYGRIQRDHISGKKFDYAGCLYPEGMLDSKEVMLFNNDDIDMIYFIGFQDADELAYRQALENAINENEEN